MSSHQILAEEWSSFSDEGSDSDDCLEDSKDEDLFYEMGSVTKLQFRKDVSKARWKDEVGMAEVMERKGRLLASMGIIRNGNIYCSIEETMFLAEIGALVLADEKETTMSLKEIYEKVAQGKSGCSWEGFEVYRHLKSLGYIVGRHGIPWSLKSIRSVSLPAEYTSDETYIVQQLYDLSMKDAKPAFEVYLPNSKFRKTSPGDPSFVVHMASGHPPSRSEVEEVERLYNGIPVKIGHVEHGRVSFFSFRKVELPLLP